MGQTCQSERKQNTKCVNQSWNGQQLQNKLPEHSWTREAQVQEEKSFAHNIPKPSVLKVKTLTSINQLSQKSRKNLQRPVKHKSTHTNQFFKQFETLKQLLQTQENLSDYEDQDNQKQNQQPQYNKAVNGIGQSLNEFVKKEQIFKKIQINIQDFVKISDEPITQYYQFKQKVGQGSFGNVYRGICLNSGQERAIKVLKKKQMTKETKKQFLAQMELLSKLDHPNIIKVYQLYYYNNFYYVVTQFCKGGPILNYVNRNKSRSYDDLFISKVMKQILSAVSYMHQECIAHLDIKLQNVVFLDQYDSNKEENKSFIKLIDFGCAKKFIPFKKKKTKIVGTLSYIAPQCLKGYFSQKSDMWSIGVLLYILLTGISPFKGKTSSQTMKNIQTKELDFQDHSLKKISTDVKKLLSGLLQRNPSKRLSARQALLNPWFQKCIKKRGSTVINQNALNNLQKYYSANNLVTVIQTFISLKKINQKQRQKLAQIFQQIDQNGNGSIQIGQLMNLYKNHFGHHSTEQIQHLINKIDINKSGTINFNQFLMVMSDRKTIFETKHLMQAFNYFDTDKTGFLQKKQLKQILKGCQKQEFDFMLFELDKDGDDRISKEEFINYLSKIQ